MKLSIRCATSDDDEALVTLWQRCELTRPWNDPRRDIARRLAIEDDLFLVGNVVGNAAAMETAPLIASAPIVASAMGGYDGHRGWVYYVAVDPLHRSQGYAAHLMRTLEERLRARGCAKLNLQVRTDNAAAVAFYRRLGYAVDETASLGKRLIADD